MKNEFNKKTFTAKLFFSDTGFLLWNIPKIISVFRNNKITKAFLEKIMTVTTAVNGCVYCSWYHAKKVIDSGISEEEIKNMMNLQFEADGNEFELPALLYAQNFAETDRKPDTVVTTKLFNYYGEKTAQHIILIVRMIFWGNLYGNTWDAVLSRFKGSPAKNSNVIFELFFFIINFWIMFPTMMVMKKDKETIAS